MQRTIKFHEISDYRKAHRKKRRAQNRESDSRSQSREQEDPYEQYKNLTDNEIQVQLFRESMKDAIIMKIERKA